MESLNTELTPAILALVPVIAGVIQVLKRAKGAEALKPWLSIIALALGVGLCYATKVPEPILPGIIVGLMSSGAYSVLKNGVGATTKKK
jgi:hypothetical protein